MRLDSFSFAALALTTFIISGGAIAAHHEHGTPTKITTVKIEATGSRYEPLQYITPYLQSRHVSDYKLTTIWNPDEQKAREDWSLHTIYPFPAKLSFWAVYHAQQGERAGRDGFRPSSESIVQPARIGAVFKELWMSNPTILANHAEVVSGQAVVRDGVQYESRTLTANGTEWQVLVDPASGLPTEVSTLENDPLEGQVTNRMVFSDWREVSGVQFPFKLAQYIDGKLIRREIRQSITVNPEDVEDSLKLSGGHEQHPDADLRQWGWSMSNFFHRRMAMGSPSDADQSLNVKFSEVGEGIYQVLGSSHHNLVIVGPDGLAIVDAVWYPRRSENILRELSKRWPDKPLKYVILTHHHLDHAGGLLPYVAAGATVVTGASNEAYFRRILGKSSVAAAELLPVGEHAALNAIGRSVDVYEVRAGHANGHLAVYVPDEKLLFNSDLYSPGRPTQNKEWAREFLDAIEFHGLDVKTHVGGHGTGTKPHAHLLELLGSN